MDHPLWLLKNLVAVEKRIRRQLAEKTQRQEALQTTISDLVGVYYLRNVGCFSKTGVFQQPLPISLIDLPARRAVRHSLRHTRMSRLAGRRESALPGTVVRGRLPSNR